MLWAISILIQDIQIYELPYDTKKLILYMIQNMMVELKVRSTKKKKKWK